MSRKPVASVRCSSANAMACNTLRHAQSSCRPTAGRAHWVICDLSTSFCGSMHMRQSSTCLPAVFTPVHIWVCSVPHSEQLALQCKQPVKHHCLAHSLCCGSVRACPCWSCASITAATSRKAGSVEAMLLLGARLCSCAADMLLTPAAMLPSSLGY